MTYVSFVAVRRGSRHHRLKGRFHTLWSLVLAALSYLRTWRDCDRDKRELVPCNSTLLVDSSAVVNRHHEQCIITLPGLNLAAPPRLVASTFDLVLCSLGCARKPTARCDCEVASEPSSMIKCSLQSARDDESECRAGTVPVNFFRFLPESNF